MAAKQENLLGKFGQRSPAAARGSRALAPTKAARELVAVTVRFNRADWDRMSDFARKNRVSLQALIEHACSKLLEDEGQKPLQAVIARHRDAKAA